MLEFINVPKTVKSVQYSLNLTDANLTVIIPYQYLQQMVSLFIKAFMNTIQYGTLPRNSVKATKLPLHEKHTRKGSPTHCAICLVSESPSGAPSLQHCISILRIQLWYGLCIICCLILSSSLMSYKTEVPPMLKPYPKGQCPAHQCFIIYNIYTFFRNKYLFCKPPIVLYV